MCKRYIILFTNVRNKYIIITLLMIAVDRSVIKLVQFTKNAKCE